MRFVDISPLGLDMQVELANRGTGVLVAVSFPQPGQLFRRELDVMVFAIRAFGR